MARLFDRIIEFHVQGEIYDSKTTPENIIASYNWSYDHNMDGNIQLFGHHKDIRGCITNIIPTGKIKTYKQGKNPIIL